jgi:hypothetical protein
MISLSRISLGPEDEEIAVLMCKKDNATRMPKQISRIAFCGENRFFLADFFTSLCKAG